MIDLTESLSTPERPIGDANVVLRYCREHYLRRLVEILRLSGLSAQSVEAFYREAGAAHDELVSMQQEGFQKTAGLTASTISLVDNDDLEINIRVQDIANHLKDNAAIDHWRVQLRFMTLLNRPDMSSEKNPVGLEPIARGLKALCRTTGLNLADNMAQLDRVETQLQERLPELYMELNGLLEHHGVDAAEVQIIQRTTSGRPSGTATPEFLPSIPSALSTLQNALQMASGAVPAATTRRDEPPIAWPDVATPVDGNASNVPSEAILNHLMERLNYLQSQQLAILAGLPRANAENPAPLRALRSSDVDLPPGQPASIALDTLSLIFDELFTSPDLPDAVKAAIGGLQIPLLKQATLDPAFFNDTGHPARRLVNRMARAALGLPRDAGRDHPVCASLIDLAETLRSNLEANEGDFILYLEDLDLLIKQRDRLIMNGAESYIELVARHEARQAAAVLLRPWLTATQNKTRHPEIRRFLADCWIHVMQAANEDGGRTGERWKECEKTIDGVLWSVRSKETPEERNKALGIIPILLKRLNAELDRVGISTEERTPFLDALFELQSAALRGRPESSVAPATSASASQSCRILEENGKLVQYLVPPQSPTVASGRANANPPCREGDWIGFQLPEGEHLCGRCCWRGATTGTLLLFNADWGYAVALPPAMLEQQLTDQRARILSNASLFDDAAAKALRNTLAHD